MTDPERSSDEIIPALRCAVKDTQGKPVLVRAPQTLAVRFIGAVIGSAVTDLLAPAD